MTAKKNPTGAKKKAPGDPVRKKATSDHAKKLSMMERMKKFDGDLLQGKYDEDYLRQHGLFDRTVKRKARYWCFKIRTAIIEDRIDKLNHPKGWKKFVEGLPGFAGWEHFAVSWDIHGENPFMVVLRLQSVWQEWDQVMQRVAIPIDTPPQQLHERMQALEDEYARKNAKKK